MKNKSPVYETGDLRNKNLKEKMMFKTPITTDNFEPFVSE